MCAFCVKGYLLNSSSGRCYVPKIEGCETTFKTSSDKRYCGKCASTQRWYAGGTEAIEGEEKLRGQVCEFKEKILGVIIGIFVLVIFYR